MKKSILIAIALFFVLNPLSRAGTRERPMLARIDLTVPSAIDIVRTGDFDIAYVSLGKFADIVADDAAFARLQAAGLNPQVIHADLVAFYQSRMPVATRMGGFYTFAEALAYMDTLHMLYPLITTARDSIGATYQGRGIWMMKISDNPDSSDNEPGLFINGLIHAREPMGMEACIRYMKYLCQNYGNDSLITYLVNNREFYFVPVFNADGYEYNRQTDPNGGGMWRKNRRGSGIDLNRNWGYMWGYDNIGSSPDPNSETYRGTGPFSEPETEVIRQFIDSHQLAFVMNFHSYGGYFLYPWGYISQHTSDQPLFDVIGDTCTATNGYSAGIPTELLYPVNGESCDWQYGEQSEKPKIFGFVMELGTDTDGFWPTPSRIPVLWSHALPALLYLSRIADNPYAIDAPVSPVLSPIGDIYGDTFYVNWHHADSLNPAVAFELKEMTGFQRTTDDFETGTASWTLGGFSRRTTRHHSGAYSLFSGSQNNYNGTALLNNPITANAGDTLKFWTWYSIESGYDYAYVQFSTDGGATFINLAGTITTNSNPNGLNEGNGITGNSSNWVFAKFHLNNHVGQSGLVRLRYKTDQGTLNEGFYVDEFFPVESFQNETILGSNIPDTTFLITGRAEGDYYYQARARDAQNQWSGSSNRVVAHVHPVSVNSLSIVPRSLSLSQNYPNPFNPQTMISFSIPQRSHVELNVYDISGRLVSTVVNTGLEAGSYNVKFDAGDGAGMSISTGVYFYRLKTDTQSLTRKMIYLK